MPPTSIDGTDITGATIDGIDVQEITVDGQTVFTAGPDIPDAGDLFAHYDAAQLNLSDNANVFTFDDQTGNNHDLTAGNAPTFKTNIVNNNPIVRFDGVDDFLDVSFSIISQPVNIYLAFKMQSLTSRDDVLDSNNTNTQFLFGPRSTNYTLFAGSFISGGSPDTNFHIASWLGDGSSSTIRIDGTQVASGNPGSNGLDGITLGANAFGNLPAEVDIGEILVYPQDKSSKQSSIETYLGNKWGVSV